MVGEDDAPADAVEPVPGALEGREVREGFPVGLTR
jgi:hypothetical protein